MPAPRVLLIGFDPHAVAGDDAEQVEMAIAMGEEQLRAAGYDTTCCLFAPDDQSGLGRVVDALSAEPWECVVVGGGIRTAEEHLELFERIVNLARVLVPQAAIAFNSTSADSVDAVRRWIDTPDRERSA